MPDDNPPEQPIGLNDFTLGCMYTQIGETHTMVTDMKRKQEDSENDINKLDKRMIGLESRNRNIKSNWKNVGWFLTSGAAICSFVWLVIKAFGAIVIKAA